MTAHGPGAQHARDGQASAMVPLTRRQLLIGAAYATPVLALTAAGLADRQALPTPFSSIGTGHAFASYGINTHLSFLGHDSVWANTDAAVDWLLDLGVGAIRQSLPRTGEGRAAVKQGMNSLGAAGLRWCCPVLAVGDFTTLHGARRVVNEQLDWLQSNTDLALLDSLPGLNEPNSVGRAVADWVNLTRWAQQALYEETRKRSAFDHVPVQGPPLNMKGGSKEVIPDVDALGDLGGWLDRGDAHLYPGDDDPEVAVDERLAWLEPLHPGKPVCVSEGGYTTSVNRGYTGGASLVSEEAAALYAPKQLLVHAVHGRLFFSYELLDEAPATGDTEKSVREGGFGLVRTPSPDPDSWSAKPGFGAIRRLLRLLKDVRQEPVAVLGAEVTSETADLRTASWQRSDGKLLLAVWRAVDLFDWDESTHTGSPIAVSAEHVTISLNEQHPVAVHQPSLQDAPTEVLYGQDVNLSIGGELRMLEIG